MGQKVWVYTITSATIATFLAALVAAYNALSSSTYPELLEESASNDATHFILTAITPGKPFAMTLSTNSASGTIAGGGSSTGTGTVASSGPNDWSTAQNWSGATVPVSTDTVDFDNNSDDIKYGLAQSGVTLTALNITSTFTGTIGLSKFNTDGTQYPEYRQDYLAIGCTTVNIGQLPGNGSQRIKHDAGSVQTAWNIYNSDNGAETNLEAILLKGTHASNVLNVVKGQVGVAVFGGEVATLLTYDVGYSSSILSDSTVRFGPGVTLGTGKQSGGTLTINSAIGTSHTQTNGNTTFWAGACAQLTLQGGNFTYNSNGTLGGNTVVGEQGYLDLDQSQQPLTITNPILAYNANPLQDTFKRVSGLAVTFVQLFVPIFGPNCTLTRT